MKYSCQSSSSQNVLFFVMELKLSKCLFCNGAQALNVKNLLRSSSSGLIKLGQNHLSFIQAQAEKSIEHFLKHFIMIAFVDVRRMRKQLQKVKCLVCSVSVGLGSVQL